MILKRFYEERLAQASFLLGCSASGEAIVIDPNRDVDRYLSAARAEGLRITTVTETHIHADFVSGSRELARRTGSTLAVSGEGGRDWQYEFAGETSVRVLHDGDTIRAGNVCLKVRHTPGHTPEHLTFLLIDQAVCAEAAGAFTGDFIFAGDVGRPDLLERAAGISGTMEAGARELFRSLQSFRSMPDRLLLWPGHGSGSACGKKLGGMPVTTLGYEKLANWAFHPTDETEFLRNILEDQPEPPRYFSEMKRVNKAGASSPSTELSQISLAEFEPAVGEQAVQVVDLRPSAEFAKGFIPGTISIPLNKNLLHWAGAVLSPQKETYLIGNEDAVSEAKGALALIGLDRVTGWLAPHVLDDWRTKHNGLDSVEQIEAGQLLEHQKQGFLLLDVRGGAEFRAGHIPGAVHIPLGRLPEEVDALSREVAIVVHCQGGSRSPVAASILRKMGFRRVANFGGGFSDYQRRGLPVQSPSREEVTKEEPVTARSHS